MTLKKINTPLNLNSNEVHLITMHSFINILNVLIHELTQFGDFIKDEKLLADPISKLVEIRKNLKDPNLTIQNFENAKRISNYLHSSLEVAIESEPSISRNLVAKRDIENILRIIEYFEYKCDRYLEHSESYREYVKFENESVKNEIERFFRITSAVSRHEFGVSFHTAKMNSNDYYLDIELPNKNFSMPVVFMDIIIDLLANARKYSAPYTTINLRIKETPRFIIISVRDQGRGIIQDEIEKVVLPQYRASNSLSKKTMGGGYGLTKAYYFTIEFKGEFYIDSEHHKGATFKIKLPKINEAI